MKTLVCLCDHCGRLIEPKTGYVLLTQRLNNLCPGCGEKVLRELVKLNPTKGVQGNEPSRAHTEGR